MSHRVIVVSLTAVVVLSAIVAVRAIRPAKAQGSPVRLGAQRLSVEIDDRQGVSMTTLRQEFVNPTRSEQPASLTLPLPSDAAFLHFAVRGVQLKKKERPEDLGSAQIINRNQVEARVVRVPAKGRASFELTYAQLIPRRGMRRKYVYPVSEPSPSTSPTDFHAEIRITALPQPEQVSSSTHKTILRRPVPGVVVLNHDRNQPPDGRDLVIDYTTRELSTTQRGSLAVLYPQDRTQDPFFMLTLPPPAALLRKGLREQPADIVFCMDISGSTRGRQLNAIQEALHDGLLDLLPGDRFTVLAFDDDVRAFRKALLPVNPSAVTQAMAFVNKQRPAAGSDPKRALEQARQLLSQAPKPGRRRIIAVLIDSEDPSNLAEAAHSPGKGVRIVALGAQPDSRIIQYRVTRDELRSGPAVALSRAALTFGPALTGAKLDTCALNTAYVYPEPAALPGLPLSSPVVLFGRLNQAPPGSGVSIVTGAVEGKQREIRIPWSTRTLPQDSPLRGMWAARRIHRLRQLAAAEPSDLDEVVQAAQHEQSANHLVTVPPQ